LYLDNAYGRLKPRSQGGGNQTKTLHLINGQGKEYSIRSVNKTLGKVLPEKFRNTFIEDLVNDEVSMSNPYAAATVPYLADNAKIYHTNPTFVYVPKQSALAAYNDVYGNNLFLFEQKVDGNWKDANNLGNFEKFFETEEVLDTLKSCSNCIADQKAFIKARLFDMFINDWDRHEKQWSWGARKINNKIVFIPVPKDRDQAYSKHNGLILSLALSGLPYMQSFDDDLKNVTIFNYEERNLDRRLMNEVTLNDWQSIATDLQRSLTDDVIEKAVQNLPKEIYPLVGKDIINKLKTRRNHITEWATEYYTFLSKEVEIPGTNYSDSFYIQRVNNDATMIEMYHLNNNKSEPFYSRNFISSETKEIRLFGLKGDNKYVFKGNDNAIKIKIISESNSDAIITSNKKNNVIIYKEGDIKANTNDVKIINDTTNRSYRYDWFRYNKKGLSPSLFYSYEDHLYAGLGYKTKHFAWAKEPFASNQLIDLHYSLMENAFSITYKALFPELVAHTDLSLLANYDAIRWTHFFGLGNETQFASDKKTKYYTMRSRQWVFQPALIKTFGHNTVSIFANMNGIKVIDDTSRFVNQTFYPVKSDYDWQTFAGGGISYSFQDLNNVIIPTKGFYFNAIASGVKNINKKSFYNFKYSGTAHIYLPLVSKFSLGLRAGATTITGNPEFFQYASIGGPTLRGFTRDRFWGKTAFYNTNDLRFISNIHTHFLNGSAGLLAFFDDGRVWMPGENSNTWHTAVGGGIILAPFDFISGEITYGFSKNEKSLQVRVTTYIKEKK